METDMNKKRLAVIFPGMGYHKDKPLLYYSLKLVQGKGYEIINIEYHDLPEKVRGDAAIGESDPWSDLDNVRRMADEHRIELYTYPDCNHSLESADVIKNIEYMKNVMCLSNEFIDRENA